MAVPVYRGAGAGATGTTSVATPYPASIAADDLLLLQVHANEALAAPITMSGLGAWTLINENPSSGTSTRNVLLYAKKAVGTESGNLTINEAGNTRLHARMYRFDGWLADATLANNFEGAATNGWTTSTAVAPPSVTSTAADRLAVAFVYVNDDNAVGNFTGESGGDWTEAVAEYTNTTGNDVCLQLQTADMAAAGTITGGSYVMAASDPWFVQAFAIKPAAGGGATGHPAMRRWGGTVGMTPGASFKTGRGW